MPARKRKQAVAANGDEAKANLQPTDKIARLLALIVVRDMEPDDAALKLDGVGFTAREISGLLGVGPNYVNVARHRKKGNHAKKTRKKR